MDSGSFLPPYHDARQLRVGDLGARRSTYDSVQSALVRQDASAERQGVNVEGGASRKSVNLLGLRA
jgi:hypothetical protein